MDRITFITTTFLPEINGVSTSMSHLIRLISQSGVHVKVLAPDYSEISDLLDSSTADELEEYCRIERYSSKRFLGYPYARVPVRRAVRYHSESGEKVVVMEADRFQLGNGRMPVVGGEAIAFMRQDYLIAAQMYFPRWAFGLFKGLIRRFVASIYNKYKAVFVLSEFSKSRLIDAGVVRPVYVVPQGLDHSLFCPQPPVQLKQPLVITYVGRIALEKNLDLLFSALEESGLSSSEISVNIVGDGPLLDKFRDRNPGGIVSFLGFKTQPEIVSIISKSHFVINPCPCETFGNTVIEAMSCGRPVIGVREGAVAGLIGDENGILVDNDSTALSDVLQKLVEGKFDYESLCEGAIRFSSGFTWEKASEELLGVVDRVLE